MRAVNLLPPELAGQGSLRLASPRLLGGAAALVICLFLAVASLLAGRDVRAKRAELEAARAKLAVVSRPEPAPGSGGSAETQTRTAAVSAALAHRVAWDRLFRRISLVMPADAWLTRLRAQAPNPAAGGGDTTATTPGGMAPVSGLELSGYSYTYKGVSRLLKRLALVPDLQKVELKSSDQARVSGGRRVQFTIGAQVRPEESA